MARSLTPLALLYYAQGKYKEAELLLTRAVAMCEKALGSEHPDLAQSLNALALIHLAQGRYAEAEPLAQLALQIRQQSLGAAHPATVATRESYTALLRELKDESDSIIG